MELSVIESRFESLSRDLNFVIDPVRRLGQLVQRDDAELKDIERQGLKKNAAIKRRFALDEFCLSGLYFAVCSKNL
ncbi:MAG TPA: hypothetical protein VKE91_14665 [Blastocatellia bacterium]|nr:hypothetical protein [Blastocatellia bacterium]